ncbi:VOC family protein [Kaistia adipata]|uniref:VOC family protein n=1 Tax=Kaistia adipata TaxID=166954 RepID=UPI0004145708|nr:VOC family protein [Kaistia adipata]
MIAIDHLDHLVLTVASIERTCDFYSRALGMSVEAFAEDRVALRFGRQKINLHKVGQEFEPRARFAVAGSADFCFVTATPVEAVAAHLAAQGVPVELGPVPRIGAEGPLLSVYLRDPDGNLVEIANAGRGEGATG